jgi:hypothetical protein
MILNSILLGTNAALMLGTPAMGNITLTNGDFSSDSTGWSTLAGFTSTLYNTTGGVAIAPGDGSNRSIYQKVSASSEAAATIIFDVTVNTLGATQDIEFRLINGPAGNVVNSVVLVTDRLHRFVLFGGGVKLFTSEFAVTEGTTYTISLYMSGMDGPGGQMGKVSGSILDNTTMVATRFTVTHPHIAPFDGLAFFRRAGNAVTGHQNTIDNITAVRELATDL